MVKDTRTSGFPRARQENTYNVKLVPQWDILVGEANKKSCIFNSWLRNINWATCAGSHILHEISRQNGDYYSSWNHKLELQRERSVKSHQLLRVASGEPEFVKYEARSIWRSSYIFKNGWVWFCIAKKHIQMQRMQPKDSNTLLDLDWVGIIENSLTMISCADSLLSGSFCTLKGQ